MILSTHGFLASQISQFSGLLDLYPNAAAAYSLRKLRKDYTGSAIEVRRTNNDVADIGFTFTGELDTAALIAFTGTGALDNGFVTKWYDQSGNGYNATQTTALNQPQIVSAGSVVLENGKPSIEFDGIDDFLSNGTTLTLPSNVSIFTIFKNVTFINNQRFYHIKSSSNNISMTRNFTSISQTVFRTLTDDVNYFGPVADTSNQSLLSIFDSDTLYQNTNIVVTKSNNQSAYFGNSGIYLGARADGLSPANVNFQEFIYYPSDELSNRTGIQDNINDFYSIY
jgi:hypothetical protein